MRKVTAAVTQMGCSRDREENLQKAEGLVRQAAEQGAQIILLQELFETRYFCQTQNFAYMRTEASWAFTERRIYRTACPMRKNFILRPGIRVFVSGIPDTGGSAWESAGTSGFRRRPGAWFFWERNCSAIPRPSARSPHWELTQRLTGSAACRDRRQPIWFPCLCPTGSARRQKGKAL